KLFGTKTWETPKPHACPAGTGCSPGNPAPSSTRTKPAKSKAQSIKSLAPREPVREPTTQPAHCPASPKRSCSWRSTIRPHRAN
ncbi:hypothetical protein B0T16DRAFT_440661, partial [Cercophora newfieldiana]